jgi:hypothetical protein
MTRKMKIWMWISLSIPVVLVSFLVISFSACQSLARRRLEPMLEQRAKQIFADQKIQEQLLAQISKDSENDKENPSAFQCDTDSEIGFGVVKIKSGEIVFVVYVDCRSNGIAELDKVWYWGKDRILRVSNFPMCACPGQLGSITCAADISELRK